MAKKSSNRGGQSAAQFSGAPSGAGSNEPAPETEVVVGPSEGASLPEGDQAPESEVNSDAIAEEPTQEEAATDSETPDPIDGIEPTTRDFSSDVMSDETESDPQQDSESEDEKDDAPEEPTPPAPEPEKEKEPELPPTPPSPPEPKVEEELEAPTLRIEQGLSVEVRGSNGRKSDGTFTATIARIIDIQLEEPNAYVKVNAVHAKNVLYYLKTAARTLSVPIINAERRAKAINTFTNYNGI